MISLLAPLGLLALVSLAVPLLIHRVRQPEKRVVAFAALRWLRPQALPRQSWQWHEKRLLALRLLLLALLASLLALPVWHRTASAGTRWVLVSPALALDAVRAALPASGTAWRWLAPEFPVIAAGGLQPPPSGTDVSSLLRELDAMLPPATPLTVVVPQQLAGADAQRLRLRREVDWRVLPAVPLTASLPVAPGPAPWKIALRHDSSAADEVPVARALMQAWQAQGGDLGLEVSWAEGEPGAVSGDTTTVPIPPSARSVVWLGATSSPVLQRWLERGGTALASRQRCAVDELGELGDEPGEGQGGAVPQASASGATSKVRFPAASVSAAPSTPAPATASRNRLVCLPAALTPLATPALLDPALPARWLALLAPPSMRPVSDSVAAEAVSPLKPAHGSEATGADAHSTAGARLPLDAGMAALIALLFAAERLWATRRSTGRA